MKRKGIFDRILDSMGFIAGLLLIAALVIVCLEICMRYFAKRPQVWSVEVCEYLLFSIAFFGAAWLLKEGGHVNIDLVLGHLNPKVQRFLQLFSAAAGVFISAVICVVGIVEARNCYMAGAVVTKTLTIPTYLFLILISLGYLALLGEFFRQFLTCLRGAKEGQ